MMLVIHLVQVVDGLAGLGVVCVSGQKGRGITGSSQPVGDPYDIDYVSTRIRTSIWSNTYVRIIVVIIIELMQQL